MTNINAISRSGGAKRALLGSVITLAMGSSLACSSSSTDEEEVTLEGRRWKTTLVRGADEVEWVAIQGTFEWWFFAGGVFRQIASQYVEPQFYGPNQACNGSASGVWAEVPTEGEAEGEGEADTAGGEAEGEAEEGAALADQEKVLVTLTYDGAKDVKGLCRMTDRQLSFFIQPSGVVDVLDNKRVVRLEFMENLR